MAVRREPVGRRHVRGLAVCVLTTLLATGCSGLPEWLGGEEDEPAAPPALGAGAVQRDETFATRDSGPLGLDLFLPDRGGGEPPRAFVVHVHGGGWNAGDRALDDDRTSPEAVAAGELLEHGYAVATVDHRSADAAHFPAQAVDVADAVRWLQDNAQRWQLDPDRVALWGSSSGGHLAAQVGSLAEDAARSDAPNHSGSAGPTAGQPLPGGGLTGIRGVVNWFGPTDMSVGAYKRDPDEPIDERSKVGRLLGCAPSRCPERADAASPVRNISGSEPPYLVQHGEADAVVPLEQNEAFVTKAQREGVSAVLHGYPGVGHDFEPDPPVGEIASTMVSFVEDHI